MSNASTLPAPASPADSPEAIARAQVLVNRVPVVLNNRSFGWITESVSSIVEGKTPLWWWILFLITAGLTSLIPISLTYLIATGIGVWGSNSPFFWAWDITNFVFWVGIAHAGTLISAILLLTRQKWRNGIARAAEASTIFALMCGGVYPAIHVGRVWMAWYLAPVPQASAIWPNFRSPLLWDVFAVTAYLSVSSLFWYIGLIPDFATLRSRTRDGWKKKMYHILSLGWTGSARNWQHYEMGYLCLAGLAMTLVFSVSSTVSFDFATSVIPGWHTTIFAPYFVIGAIYAGFAMVLTLLIPLRQAFPQLKDIITLKHVDNMCKITLLACFIVTYIYAMEMFMAWYSGNPVERYTFYSRAFGPYYWAYWALILFNVLIPQLLWFKAVRSNLLWVWILVQFPNVGMWCERFVIVVTSLTRDYLPSSWGIFHPTISDMALFAGTLGFFFMLFLLFVRFVPVIAIAELKAVMPEANPHHSGSAEASKGALHS